VPEVLVWLLAHGGGHPGGERGGHVGAVRAARGKFPNSKITSISNSNSQREFIMGQAKERGLNNVTVFTGDIATFDLPKEYYDSADRVISIEMFEHMKNYELLMEKISKWVKPDGKVIRSCTCGFRVHLLLNYSICSNDT
jgi:cyclopropane fatty-acyl-phospholipid synthase-like methyltransferase